MSEFDKEAEREKLREKYGEDDAGREATQRMSQLLLQGATMTNRHCDRCGDPIFRQNDQEFCPTCNAEAQAGDTEAQAGDAGAQRTDVDTRTAAPGEQSADTGAQPADSRPSDRDAQPDDAAASPANAAETTASTGRPSDASPSETGGASGPAEFDAANVPPAAGDGRQSVDPNAASGPAATSSGIQSSASTGDLADADAALVRALNRFAGAAAQTDDPRRAKENLEAAREAAEALDALRR